jgi:hypothetical protein
LPVDDVGEVGRVFPLRPAVLEGERFGFPELAPVAGGVRDAGEEVGGGDVAGGDERGVYGCRLGLAAIVVLEQGVDVVVVGAQHAGRFASTTSWNAS